MNAMQYRVLIIEPETILGLGLKAQFTQWGWNSIQIVESGEKGLEMVNEQLPDLLVINVVLSGQLDGIQTGRLIQNVHPVPFILIHFRQPSREQKRELRNMGPYIWLNKPFQVEKLQTAVESLLQTSYQKQE